MFMGVRESASELEAAMSELEGSGKAKPKKTEGVQGRQSDSRLEKIEDSIGRIEAEIEEIKSAATQPSEKADVISEMQEKLEALQKSVSEIEYAPAAEGKDFSADIEGLKRSVAEMKSIIASLGALRGGEPSFPKKDLFELKSRMDVLQKYVDGRINALQVPQKGGEDKAIDGNINSRLNDLSRRIEEISRQGFGKIIPAAGADRNIDEKLKLFALNSDFEKVWKETENLKRYVDEKSKFADGLANSLRAWETRNLQLMEKERDFDDKMKAFPELKMLEGRLRKIERSLTELQRHFVAAQIAEPIIME